MKLTLEIWRQAGPTQEGKFETVQVDDASEQMSILELLDHVNEGYVERGEEPFAFASDCREGICGTCGVTVNGRPHGPAGGVGHPGVGVLAQPLRHRPQRRVHVLPGRNLRLVAAAPGRFSRREPVGLRFGERRGLQGGGVVDHGVTVTERALSWPMVHGGSGSLLSHGEHAESHRDLHVLHRAVLGDHHQRAVLA